MRPYVDTDSDDDGEGIGSRQYSREFRRLEPKKEDRDVQRGAFWGARMMNTSVKPDDDTDPAELRCYNEGCQGEVTCPQNSILYRCIECENDTRAYHFKFKPGFKKIATIKILKCLGECGKMVKKRMEDLKKIEKDIVHATNKLEEEETSESEREI